VFCANFLRVSNPLHSFKRLYFRHYPDSINQTSTALRRAAWSTELQSKSIAQISLLLTSSSGLGLVRSASRALTPWSNAWTALRPARPIRWSNAKLLLLYRTSSRPATLIARSVAFRSVVLAASLRLPECNRGPGVVQAESCGSEWKRWFRPVNTLQRLCHIFASDPVTLHERAAPSKDYGRTMTPRSASPLTKYCTASDTSSRPMMRTRMRMPVSPRARATRVAPPSTR
jgi:hypothetical protein